MLPARKPSPVSSPAALPSAPVWVWLATAAGVFIGFLLLLWLAFWSEKQQSRAFTEDAETVLRREWTNRTDSVMRVVVLGTSLVEYGVANPDFFARRCGRRVRVVKLFREGVNIDAFTEGSPVFQLLARYPPHVLCIEESLLLFNLPYPMRPAWTTKLSWTLNQHLELQVKSLLRRLGLLSPRQQFTAFQARPPFYHLLNQNDTLRLSVSIDEIRRREVRTKNELPALAESLRQLRQRGVQVVLLNIPRPAALETIIQGETRAPKLRELIAYYNQQNRVGYWRFNQAMPFSYFADYAHLNYRGNPVYSAWLADTLCTIRTRSRS